MIVHLIREPATKTQLDEMGQFYGGYIKVAVDVRRRVLSGGGEWHADCEELLLQDGSVQEDVWGAGYTPATNEVVFDALINIRPRQGNRSLVIQSPELRKEVEAIVRWLLTAERES